MGRLTGITKKERAWLRYLPDPFHMSVCLLALFPFFLFFMVFLGVHEGHKAARQTLEARAAEQRLSPGEASLDSAP